MKFFLKFSLSLVVLILISIVVISYTKDNSVDSLISPLAGTVKGAKAFIGNLGESAALAKVVNDSLEGTRGTYGIVIKNLKTGESFSQNEDTKFASASLYKLWVLGTVYERLESGDLERSDVLSQDVADLNKMFKIASDSAELTEGTITETIEDAINRMITVSDNYSALLLSSKVRNSAITEFLKDYNFTNSNLGDPPQTTPKDTALFFEKLYKGEVIDKENSDEMLEILKGQKLNDRIPKYLENDVEVAHKTGELEGFKHDAGIIYGDEPILIIVLSKSTSPQAAAERIAILSRDVYRYFTP